MLSYHILYVCILPLSISLNQLLYTREKSAKKSTMSNEANYKCELSAKKIANFQTDIAEGGLPRPGVGTGIVTADDSLLNRGYGRLATKWWV